MPSLAADLKVTTETGVYAGRRCLELIDPKLFSLKDAERALKSNPDLPETRFQVGIALANLEEYEKALLEFDQVARQEPGHVKTHNARGFTLLRRNKLPEAVEAFQHAIEIETNYADSHYNLACTYSRLNRFEECLNHLSRAKELDGFQGMNPLLGS
jgi:tetratricopeptide (TPR) repeat protein